MLLYIYGFFIIWKIHTLSKSLKFDQNYEMLGKNQGKILLKYYQQTLLDFSITLWPSQASMPFHTTFLSVSFAVKFPKTSSFFWIFFRRKSFSTKTTDFSSFVLKTRGPFHCSQSLNYSIISSVDKEPSFGFWWKLCYSSPNHLMRENFVSRSAFCLSFIFVFWPIETTTANLQGVNHSMLLTKRRMWVFL